MILKLQRQRSTPTATFGDLSVDGMFECHTLERPEVQIPSGTYSIEITFSPRFQRLLPLLDSVPGRTDIRIHAGNWPRDTEGCILVGQTLGVDMISNSLLALNPLVEKIQAALASEQPVQISVCD